MIVDETFLATVTGAGIAGGVGILTLLVQLELESRRQLDEGILAPAFNYVTSLPPVCPWSGLTDPPWAALDSYHWLRIPARFRLLMLAMSPSIEAHRVAWGRYFEFMGGPASASFRGSVQTALKSYTSGDGTAVHARDIGLEGGATIQLNWIVAAVVPYFALEPSDPVKAWTCLETEGVSNFYWASMLASALRVLDPAALARVFGNVTRNPDFKRARELALAMRDAYGPVLEQGRAVEKLLGRRLGVARVLKDAS